MWHCKKKKMNVIACGILKTFSNEHKWAMFILTNCPIHFCNIWTASDLYWITHSEVLFTLFCIHEFKNTHDWLIWREGTLWNFASLEKHYCKVLSQSFSAKEVVLCWIQKSQKIFFIKYSSQILIIKKKVVIHFFFLNKIDVKLMLLLCFLFFLYCRKIESQIKYHESGTMNILSEKKTKHRTETEMYCRKISI